MTKNSIFHRVTGFLFAALALVCISIRAQETAEIGGSYQLTLGEVNSPTDYTTIYDPYYMIAAIAIVQEPVFSGTTDSVSAGTNEITLAVETDLEGNSLPSFAVNHLASGTVRATAAVSGGAITGITVVPNSVGSDLTAVPTVTIDDPDTGTDAAIGTAVLAGDAVGSITFTGGASGYSSAPSVSVDSGPHLIRITSGSNEGRFFRISANTATKVTIDAASLGGESLTASTAFNAAGKDAIEIIRATTLADAFGATAADVELDTGPTASQADWVYLWSSSSKLYVPFFFKDDSIRNLPGWYKTSDRRFRRPKNDEVLYPDQAFIIARRNAGGDASSAVVNPEFEGVVQITDTRLRLPAFDAHFLTTNPFGADVFLTELISINNVGASASKFYPGVDDEAGDVVYVLSSSGAWTKYYHNLTNVTVGQQAICTAIRTSPAILGGQVTGAYLAYPANPNSLVPSDPTTIIGVSNPAPGVGTMTITTGSAHLLQVGDWLRIKGVKGYKTNEDNTKFIQKGTAGAELPMTAANMDPAITRVIEGRANGDWEVLATPTSDTFKIGSSGNCVFIAGGAYWRTGGGGTNYTADAKVYFIGNGASNAVGTANVSAGKVTSITITNQGSLYGATQPQAVFSSNGWRDKDDLNADVGNTIISGGAGILIYRHADHDGELTFLKASNPAKTNKDD